MAVIYNNQVCVFANELITYNAKRNIGSEKGFIPEGTFQSKSRRGLIAIARRSTPKSPALVYFDTMEEYIKNQYIKAYGDPHEEFDAVLKQSLLECELQYNEEAYTFFTDFTDEAGKKMKPEKAALYTLQARVLDAVLRLYRENRRSVGDGTVKVSVWDNLSRMVNDLLSVRNSRGEQRYPHKLPSTGKTLQRKALQYEKEGFYALVNKNHGNTSTRKVKDEECEAVMHKLLSQHMNLNNVQIMEQYNLVIRQMNLIREAGGEKPLPFIKSPATVDAYRKEMESTSLGHRRGGNTWKNKYEMQIKRTPPETAMTYWTLDGWEVELVYEKQVIREKVVDGEIKRTRQTSYTNRKCMVVVLDACGKYPVGYAIGDHESPALIRTALRNAVKHTKELFGSRYKPMQLQSDNYQKKVMVPFYEAMTVHYTPAALGNAKSKIIEPYFNHINKTYCQMLPNWSGVNINAKRDSQPNIEILNRNRHLIPTEEVVIQQIHTIMNRERELKRDAYLKAWAATPGERRIAFNDDEYLFLMGETTGRTNRLTGQGLLMELMGQRLNFETFNMELRNHYNEDWVVHYDPEDLSQVLICNAESTSGHRVKKEIGTLRFTMQRDITVPMALADQKPEHFEHRSKVRKFNDELEQRYIDRQNQVDETLQGMISRYPQLKSNTLLDRALITDIHGQHKDRRSEARDAIADAVVVEEEAIPAPKRQLVVPAAQEDDDSYEWNPTDMRFSR